MTKLPTHPYPKVCIIGGGPSGLASAKNLLDLGIPCDVFESHSDIGGIWDIANPKSTVYESTYTITSKTVTAYRDFPMPDHYPTYLHHTMVLEYLRAYAQKFGLHQHIHFSTPVTRVERAEKGGWLVTTSKDGKTGTARYRAVIIATGHNWSPKLPTYPGQFEGRSFHSNIYKRVSELAGRRVLIVGSGNTGCDIAVESARVAEATFLSARRGYYYLPKYLLGIPSDSLGQSSQSLMLPIWLIRIFYRLLVWVSMGDQTKYGLPKPDHALLQTPPVANSLIPYYVSHGALRMKPDITRFEGKQVFFKDGSSEELDVILYATGYKPDFPFIDQAHLAWRNERPNPYLYLFHPKYDDLFFAGLTDGTGGHFPTVDDGTRLIARFLYAQDSDPASAAEFAKKKAGPPPDLARGIRFLDAPRNYTQFELHYYTRLLRQHTEWFRSRAERVRPQRTTTMPLGSSSANP